MDAGFQRSTAIPRVIQVVWAFAAKWYPLDAYRSNVRALVVGVGVRRRYRIITVSDYIHTLYPFHGWLHNRIVKLLQQLTGKKCRHLSVFALVAMVVGYLPNTVHATNVVLTMDHAISVSDLTIFLLHQIHRYGKPSADRSAQLRSTTTSKCNLRSTYED